MLNLFKKPLARSRGDTLVEVLFAVSVFSLVVVGSLSIMNQGTATAERALEITLVRQQIDSQAEALRYLNASYIDAYPNAQIDDGSLASQWMMIQKIISDNPKSDVPTVATCDNKVPSGSFILNTKPTADDDWFKNVGGTPNSLYSPANSFSMVRFDVDSDPDFDNTDGLWIEAVRDKSTNQSNADYIDFHINACWYSPGQTTPMTIGTIVRLYEPI